MNTPPELATLYDVINKENDIINYVKENPSEDIVYSFKSIDLKINHVNQLDVVIAGSKAITLLRKELKLANLKQIENHKLINQKYIQDFLKTYNNTSVDVINITNILHQIDAYYAKSHQKQLFGDFTANDTDLFIINSPDKQRFTLDDLDIIHTTHKSIDALILDFDLPCCRVARDLQNTFHVSLQCLYSLLTGFVYVPHYVFDETLYKGINFNKLTFRREKYKKRGYTMRVYHTDKVLSCYLNGFKYN
ncbi:MAG TPA: hypothetical protein VLG50_02185 [Candidatus Saccharimonadales bacterium]|nr:hypothetical protein [Candidatus Saccharimonadales bacterium]